MSENLSLIPRNSFQSKAIIHNSYLRSREACLKCRYLGKNLNRTESEANNGYSYACDKHKATNIILCQTCQDHSERKPNNALEPTRHLIYHLWPNTENEDVWKWNLDELKKRWSLFNGRKIIAVAMSEDSATMDQVQDYLNLECEWIGLSNNPLLREVKSFTTLWFMLRNQDGDNHFTFFAHGKGVKNRKTVRPWASLLYHLNLDYWSLINSLLKDHSMAGAFKKYNWYGFPCSIGSWHYSGSFYWVKNKDLFSLSDWSMIDQMWYGVESWPGLRFRHEQGATIFYEREGNFNLYRPEQWPDILREFEKWKRNAIRYLHVAANVPETLQR